MSTGDNRGDNVTDDLLKLAGPFPGNLHLRFVLEAVILNIRLKRDSVRFEK